MRFKIRIINTMRSFEKSRKKVPWAPALYIIIDMNNFKKLFNTIPHAVLP